MDFIRCPLHIGINSECIGTMRPPTFYLGNVPIQKSLSTWLC